MAIITDIELQAGFQVRVRWYAQATQRYPSNENEYYSTFFNTLEPNEQFSLSDPRFDINAINDNPEDLQYVIRDVCHTQTLIPQFVDFIYINPDYTVTSVLVGRVDGGVSEIVVQANPDSNFGSFTLAAGNRIQIGPIQSDVYEIASVSGTTITLTTPTTKTFQDGAIVALSNTVIGGRYPDTTAETALSRILDNTGSLFTGTIQVTTPLFFDVGETVRRFYYDSALQTPFNGARGSGDTENLIVIDPRDITREVEAGWWVSGDEDNEAAEEACLIDSQGFLIGKRDRAHAFQQILYYAQGENAACTASNPTLFVTNHPDFTDTGFTSIRNDDASLSLPPEGFYSWADPSIIVTDSLVSIFFGDNQFRPGYDPGTGVVPSITFSGVLGTESVSFTIVGDETTEPVTYTDTNGDALTVDGLLAAGGGTFLAFDFRAQLGNDGRTTNANSVASILGTSFPIDVFINGTQYSITSINQENGGFGNTVSTNTPVTGGDTSAFVDLVGQPLSRAGGTLADEDDSWIINRGSIATSTLGDLNGVIQNITSDQRATNRFVRYWTGTQFDAGRVHPTLLVDNCPTPLGLSASVSIYSTQQNAACQEGGTSLTVWYTTVSSSNEDFAAGNVSGIFTDQFGFESDEPSSLGVSYVRFNNTVYLWNGNALTLDNAACVSRFCPQPGALNFGQDAAGNPIDQSTGIADNSQCRFPRVICTDISADNYVAPGDRRETDLTDNSTCTFPVIPSYLVVLNRGTGTITGPSAGFNINAPGAAGFAVGNPWSVEVTITLNDGYEWVGNAPVVSYDPGSSGPSLADGQTQTVTYNFTDATVELVAEVPDPNSASYVYGTSANVACAISGDLDTRTLYWSGLENLGIGVSVFSDQGLTTPAATGYYAFALQTIFVSGGSVQTGFTACPVEPEPDPFTAPTNFSADVVGNPGGSGSSSNPYIMQASDTISFTYSFTDPDDLVTSPQVVLTRSDLFSISQQTDDGVTIMATSFPSSFGNNDGAVIITGRYTNPDTGAIVSFGTETVYLRIQQGF